MKILSALGTCLFLFQFSTLAQATLGEVIDSSTKSFNGSTIAQKVATSEKYSTHEYEKDGSTIREYTTPAGIVFAVSWRGVSKPDLNALFGSYFNEYNQGLDEVPKQYGVKTISIKTAKIVVRRGNRMRDQRGFAFIPSMVPEGVNIEGLQ